MRTQISVKEYLARITGEVMRTKAWLCKRCAVCPHRFEGHTSQKFGICANCDKGPQSVVWCVKDWTNGTTNDNVSGKIPK
jgi:hypothetical protein